MREFLKCKKKKKKKEILEFSSALRVDWMKLFQFT